MSTKRLTQLAEDLQRQLEGKLTFYFRVGWMRESSHDLLMVYYDQRQSLPPNAVPAFYRNVKVRTQPTLPPGVAEPRPEDYGYAWMSM